MIEITYWNFVYLVICLSFILFFLFKIWGKIHADELKKQEEHFNKILDEQFTLSESFKRERNLLKHESTCLKHTLKKRDKDLQNTQAYSARRAIKLSRIDYLCRVANTTLPEWLKENKHR
jgi:hypothetical protein